VTLGSSFFSVLSFRVFVEDPRAADFCDFPFDHDGDAVYGFGRAGFLPPSFFSFFGLLRPPFQVNEKFRTSALLQPRVLVLGSCTFFALPASFVSHA